MKMLIAGFALLLAGCGTVYFFMYWAFASVAKESTAQLSDIAPRISATLPVLAMGLIAVLSGVVLLVCAFVKAIRNKAGQ